MTLAELLITVVILCGVFWLLHPLRRKVTDTVARLMGLNRPGRVINGEFRSVKPEQKDRE